MIGEEHNGDEDGKSQKEKEDRRHPPLSCDLSCSPSLLSLSTISFLLLFHFHSPFFYLFFPFSLPLLSLFSFLFSSSFPLYFPLFFLLFFLLSSSSSSSTSLSSSFFLFSPRLNLLEFPDDFLPTWLISLWFIFAWYAYNLVPVLKRFSSLAVVLVGGFLRTHFPLPSIPLLSFLHSLLPSKPPFLTFPPPNPLLHVSNNHLITGNPKAF